MVVNVVCSHPKCDSPLRSFFEFSRDEAEKYAKRHEEHMDIHYDEDHSTEVEPCDCDRCEPDSVEKSGDSTGH